MDNAKPYNSIRSVQISEDNKFKDMSYTPYSPDIALWNNGCQLKRIIDSEYSLGLDELKGAMQAWMSRLRRMIDFAQECA
jgi:hypothetical protein